MNILIPHHWLLEHLDTKASPQKIQECLSLCGPTVDRIETVNGEPVYDIEVTTNRVDCMSVRGIAREAAAILPQFGIRAKLITPPSPSLPKKGIEGALDIKIVNNPRLCHRILAIKLTNIKLGPSPKWLQQRLEQVGQRPLNNVIDITNYVMWELGHPVHAFDYDRLTHKTIIVREAKPGEKLTTLDGKTHTLRGGEVVFDDGQHHIIDFPGIMGTRNTVVTATTKNVLLWTESIVPQKIRSASMTHAIRTQAAVLNEKNVDPELADAALLRAVNLMQQLAKAKIASRLIDIYPQKLIITPVTLSQDLIDTYLGIKLEPKKIISILASLGCSINYTLAASRYSVAPPSWRAQDLTIPQDYIEEIARLYGYHNLPSVIMPTAIPDHPPADNFHLEHQIKTWLADWGLTEVYTYSLVANSLDSLKIANPLTNDMVYLRRSLIPSHLEVITKNTNRGDVSLFEMANVYIPKPNHLPEHQLRLTLTTNKDFLWLKGIVESLFRKLHISATFAPTGIFVGKTKLGTIDQVTPNIYAADLLVTTLINQSNLYPHYRPLPTTAPIIEDMTFTLPPQTYLGPIIDTIKSVSPLIESVTLKDRYENNFTFTIIYRHPKNQLTDHDVAPLRSKITSKVALGEGGESASAARNPTAPSPQS